MASDLISRSALLDSLKESKEGLQKIYEGLHYEIEKRLCGAQLTTFIETILRVKEAPTVDAEPVQHAKWVNRHGYTACSNCGFFGYEVWKRCPVCECKMDLNE